MMKGSGHQKYKYIQLSFKDRPRKINKSTFIARDFINISPSNRDKKACTNYFCQTPLSSTLPTEVTEGEKETQDKSRRKMPFPLPFFPVSDTPK